MPIRSSRPGSPLAADMSAVSEALGDPELALVMARGTARLFQFLSDRGVKWDGQLKKLGGHSAARVVWPEGGGTGVIFPLHEHAAKLSNCELRKQVKVDDVVLDARGRAVGLKVRERYRFDYQAANFGERLGPGAARGGAHDWS